MKTCPHCGGELLPRGTMAWRNKEVARHKEAVDQRTAKDAGDVLPRFGGKAFNTKNLINALLAVGRRGGEHSAVINRLVQAGIIVRVQDPENLRLLYWKQVDGCWKEDGEK